MRRTHRVRWRPTHPASCAQPAKLLPFLNGRAARLSRVRPGCVLRDSLNVLGDQFSGFNCSRWGAIIDVLLNRRRNQLDRRKSEQPNKSLAKIQYNGSLPRDCTITELSASGVKLIIEDHDVPAEFTIIFSAGHTVRCRLGWRNDCEIGAEFIDYVGRPRRRRRRRQPPAK